MATYPFLLYGSYGYTGQLIAEFAVSEGLKPLLAGRDPARLRSQAARLGLDWAAFSVDQSDEFDRALTSSSLLLHAAGPFHRTYRQAAAACLRTGRHYLDITGEVPVFEGLAEMDQKARAAGVMLLPGVGFDVVPSDCLAVHLKQKLPSATHLRLAIRTQGSGLSHGTALTMAESIDQAAAVRRGGQLVQIPAGSLTRSFDFGRGPRLAVAIRWGDLSTAYHSTGIPNIETYMTFAPSIIRMMSLSARLGGILRTGPAQSVLRTLVKSQPAGPSESARQTSRSFLYGEVWDDDGRRAAARLSLPEGYALTAQTSVRIAQKILGGQASPGFQTPGGLFGPGLILEIPTAVREDIPNAAG